MRALGHHYQNPLDPPADPDFERPGGALERETAKDDVACKKSTNLVGRGYAIESAYQNIVIKKHHRELTELARAQSHQRPRQRAPSVDVRRPVAQVSGVVIGLTAKCGSDRR